MRKLILLGCIFISSVESYAAIQNNCQAHIENAIHYFRNVDNINISAVREIEKLTKECLDNTDPLTLFVKGMVYVYNDSKESQDEGFELINLSSQKGYTEATYFLGKLYKKGVGCTLNLEKAFYWYEQAAQLGHPKAAFNLGYMYFKGFGTPSQDYYKAVEWFKKSNYQLANHWLAICYKNGYGVEKDIEIAKSLLSSNYIINSKTLYQKIDDKKTEGILLSESDELTNKYSEKELHVLEDKSLLSNLDLSKNVPFGKYEGHLIQYDWSKSYIKRIIPISFLLKYSQDVQDVQYECTFNQELIKGSARAYEEKLNLENLNLVLRGLWEELNTPVKAEVELQILSVSLKKLSQDNSNLLIGDVETKIRDWNESGLPTKIILRKKFNGNVSEEANLAFTDQKNDFIKLYPVPFKKDLLISYELDKSTKTKVEITSFHGNNTQIIQKDDYQLSGSHVLRFDGSELTKGIYIIRITTNEKQYTKLVVKE